ncbi:uncharacterized protein HMPREF1541_02367 [Cyphellophora europaea CBS 101466]|uniref:Uncharacterized protein n=1 Tax=Cyphellophora europaea (strain CBS 101466) TaxID=1220924 RepID=W2S584_CYPE1|nr:uncharacterized protein HMPREF1541_02367 [Cyphellophora europaea CBS 101466]ETN43208.1 hypothetical protein HMPREF1541_02367 [Cyphellophora europaea CBS 101466]
MATPTTRNTLANSYNFDLSIRPSPVSTAVSPVTTTRPASVRAKRPLPYDLSLPIGVRSILKNSSISSDVRRASLSASPLSTTVGRKVFFPEPKRVKFGGEEEVVTRTYVARHVDLSSSEDESSVSGSESGAAVTAPSDESRPRFSTRSGEAVIVDELQRGQATRRSKARPSTRKRRRWEWTLDTGSDTKHEATAAEDEQQLSSSDTSTTSTPSVSTPALVVTDTKEPHVEVNEINLTPTLPEVEATPEEPVPHVQQPSP